MLDHEILEVIMDTSNACHCCPFCDQIPCEGVAAGGMCDGADCDCFEFDNEDDINPDEEPN